MDKHCNHFDNLIFGVRPWPTRKVLRSGKLLAFIKNITLAIKMPWENTLAYFANLIFTTKA
jgi:hypothetical protein